MGDLLLDFVFSAANNELGIAALTPKPTIAMKKSRREWFRRSSWSLVELESRITKRETPCGAILLTTVPSAI
jgi:hypothetical protein